MRVEGERVRFSSPTLCFDQIIPSALLGITWSVARMKQQKHVLGCVNADGLCWEVGLEQQ